MLLTCVVFPEQVGEDDYHQLKHDQCLRVDFKSFPRKFIELLESCGGSGVGGGLSPPAGARVDGGPDESRSRRSEPLVAGEPSFLARLETQVPGGFSIFSLVETNPFKELTHLSLKFRAGNDTAIKTYLAARLRQVGVVLVFSCCGVVVYPIAGTAAIRYAFVVVCCRVAWFLFRSHLCKYNQPQPAESPGMISVLMR